MAEYNISRRKFLRMTGAFSGAAALTGGVYAYHIEPSMTVVRHHILQTPKWPAHYAPMNITIASDFHAGCPSVDLARLKAEVVTINAQGGDAVCLLGDFMNSVHSNNYYNGGTCMPDEIAGVMSDITAPTFAVLGNHDWKEGRGGALTGALNDKGIIVLENTSAQFEHEGQGLWLNGLADETTRLPDYQKSLSDVFNDDPLICLAHDPTSFWRIDDRALVTLSGHTHGGQVAVLGTPLWRPSDYRAPSAYNRGYVHEAGKDLFVTSGIGTSKIPLRFGVRPEIVNLTIEHALNAPRFI